MLHLLAKHYHTLPSRLLKLDYDELMLNLEILAEGLRRESHAYGAHSSKPTSLEEEIHRKRLSLSRRWRHYLA
jgi:hypothetical protein